MKFLDKMWIPRSWRVANNQEMMIGSLSKSIETITILSEINV